MPAGSAVIHYDGKRGVVWRIKYRDASGKQVKETVGAERDGITRKKAEAALHDRESDVRRKQYVKPAPFTFESATKLWREQEQVRKDWKSSTLAQYVSVLERLNDWFGSSKLGEIRTSDVSAY